MIRVRRGDWVQLHLMNHPNNTMPHNIDLHAVTGPGGGAEPTFTPPGHQSQFTFRAQNPGVYMYHCATAPVGMHIANGMYGMIVVEPEDGWPRVDREYYVVQSEVYTAGQYGDRGAQTFDMDRAVREDPSYVVFNGRAGALTGDNALTANVGETVRLFVGNGGPNLVSSFHVIGEIFDRVYPEGASQPVSNVQTTLVPAGGTAMVEFHTEVPGNYPLVDHSIFRAFNKGALGMLRVGGAPNRSLYSGRESDLPYDGHGVAAAAPAHHVAPVADGAPGENTFNTVCAACHQRSGLGVASIFPPLAESDFLMADRERAIRIVLGGLNGPVQVRGQTFNGMMPSQSALLNDRQVADVLTYVRSNFGNHGDAIREAEVANVRRQLASTPATP
jgi:nitrite reductase (NO-forming)